MNAPPSLSVDSTHAPQQASVPAPPIPVLFVSTNEAANDQWSEVCQHLHAHGWPVRHLLLRGAAKATLPTAYPTLSAPTQRDVDELHVVRKLLRSVVPCLVVAPAESTIHALTDELAGRAAFVRFCGVDDVRAYQGAVEFPHAARFVCATALIQETLSRLLPAGNTKLCRQPPQTIEVPSLPPRALNGPLRLLFRSALESTNRFFDVIRLVRALERTSIDFQLSIVGQGSRKLELLSELDEHVRNGRVRFLVAFDPVREKEIYARHDVFLRFTRAEADHDRLRLAMAHGMVPLLADYDELDSALNSENSLSFPFADTDAAALAILRLASEPGLLARLSEHAIQTSRAAVASHSRLQFWENLLREEAEALQLRTSDERGNSSASAAPLTPSRHPLLSEAEIVRPSNFFRKLIHRVCGGNSRPPAPAPIRCPIPEATRAHVDQILQRSPAWVQGAVQPNDICFLDQLIEKVHPETFFEVGVASGMSSAAVLTAMARYAPASTVWLQSYDLLNVCYFNNDYALGAAAVEMVPELLPHWRLHTGTTTIDLPHARSRSGRCLYFIDAMHSHPWPVIDLIALLPRLQAGDLVLLHDIDLPAISGGRFPHYGAKWLFDAWPGEHLMPDVEKPNIGAIVMPDDWRTVLPVLLQVLAQKWDPEVPIPDEHLRECEWRFFHFLRQNKFI